MGKHERRLYNVEEHHSFIRTAGEKIQEDSKTFGRLYMTQIVNVIHHALIAVTSLQANRLLSTYIENSDNVKPAQIHAILILIVILGLYSLLLPKIQLSFAMKDGGG